MFIFNYVIILSQCIALINTHDVHQYMVFFISDYEKNKFMNNYNDLLLILMIFFTKKRSVTPIIDNKSFGYNFGYGKYS